MKKQEIRKLLLCFFVFVLAFALLGCSKPISKEEIEKFENKIKSEIEEQTKNVKIVDKTPQTTITTTTLKEKSEEKKKGISEASLKKIDEFKEKAKKVSNVRYYYREDPNFQIIYEFLVKGNKMKIILPPQREINPANYFTSIYLDTSKKTAYGYCEKEIEPLKCKYPEKEFKLEYNKYYRETPMYWTEFAGYGELQDSETINRRVAVPWEFDKNGKHYRIYIDEYSGLALYVIENYGQGEDKEFQRKFEIRPMGVKDEEVVKLK